MFILDLYSLSVLNLCKYFYSEFLYFIESCCHSNEIAFLTLEVIVVLPVNLIVVL